MTITKLQKFKCEGCKWKHINNSYGFCYMFEVMVIDCKQYTYEMTAEHHTLTGE
jgi:hypothetical protein